MSDHPIVAPKKLIEVALPLDEINKASAREKSIRHGHPSTLHLWWARRPLATARAVLFAQLVNDPSWKYSEEELKKPQIKSAITRKRNELFKLITELVQWENTNNEDVLERARAEIRASWKETCTANNKHPDATRLFDPERLPAFHDPFAGGGAIPLEAQRLGLEAHASDLNPVAVLINKAMIEIPPKFAERAPVGPIRKGETQTRAAATDQWGGASGLAEDVQRYGAWMRERATGEIGPLYPTIEVSSAMAGERSDLKPLVGQRLTVIAWLWARTVRSPNPAFADVEVPLAASFLLATKPTNMAYVDAIVEGASFRFVVKTGPPTDPSATKIGTKLSRGASFRCVVSATPITSDYIKAEGMAGRMGARLMAIVAESDSGRVYLSPTEEQERIAASARPIWGPDQEVSYDPHSGATFCVLYGLRRFRDLFTARQLVALTAFCDLVQKARSQVRDDAVRAGIHDDGVPLERGGMGATAYADAIALYLACAVDRLADRCSTICGWDSGYTKIRNTFGRQSIPMSWDFAEVNPFSASTGNWTSMVEWTSKAIATTPARCSGTAFQADAQSQAVSEGKVVSTDPPYYDNVPYADLSDYFYVWLRRSLKSDFPDLFATVAAPKADELVATPNRHGSKKNADAFFLAGMTRALQRIGVSGHPAFPSTVYYAFKQSESRTSGGTSSTGWETFLSAVIEAGLGLTGTWPMRTELGNRMVSTGKNALASSIVLVCRSGARYGGRVSRKDFLRQLDRALPVALTEMTADPEASVAPVDLQQAAIGPGMAIFSQYDAVLEADGTPMAVQSALVHINKTVDDYFSNIEGNFDGDTRFCVAWFQQRGFDSGPFGEADVLARAKGTAVDGVVGSGVLSATKGKVRLLRVNDYPKQWDPTTDRRAPVWEACHQMCRALLESEKTAGELLARMPEKQDVIRQLAYRLYTICERQKWAEEARAYNDLITSWPAIVEQSIKAGHRGEQLDLI